MKKFILILTLCAVLFSAFALPALADAMAWDSKPVDLTVYVLTPDGGLNIRWGPGKEYDLVRDDPIPDYTELHIIEQSGNWGYTKYDGCWGWVFLGQTTTEKPEQAANEPLPVPDGADGTQDAPVTVAPIPEDGKNAADVLKERKDSLSSAVKKEGNGSAEAAKSPEKKSEITEAEKVTVKSEDTKTVRNTDKESDEEGSFDAKTVIIILAAAVVVLIIVSIFLIRALAKKNRK